MLWAGSSFRSVTDSKLYKSVLRLYRFAMATIARPFTISVNESWERHLYAATSPAFAPIQQRECKGSSLFRPASNGEPCGPNPILDEDEKNGTQEKIWTKTREIMESFTGGTLAERKGCF